MFRAAVQTDVIDIQVPWEKSTTGTKPACPRNQTGRRMAASVKSAVFASFNNAGGQTPRTYVHDVNLKTNIVRACLNCHFGGPVLARY